MFGVERVWEKGQLRTSLSSSSSSNLWRLAITGSAGEEDDSDPEPEPELVSSSLSSSSAQKEVAVSYLRLLREMGGLGQRTIFPWWSHVDGLY